MTGKACLLNVERTDIQIYEKVVLFICGTKQFWTAVSLLGVGLWGEEQIVAPGEMDLRGPVSTGSLSGSQPQTLTAVGLCWMLAGP